MENLTIKLIGDDLSIAELDNIYKINQANVPEVGSIANISEFQKLLFMGSFNLIAKIDDEVIGYIVCFRENSPYQSKNYKFFKKRFKRFFYIDRIGVVEGSKNQGLGTFIYNKIDAICIKDKLPICAEVNIVPINEESIKFHEKMGFKKVSEAYSNSNYGVRYYEKCM